MAATSLILGRHVPGDVEVVYAYLAEHSPPAAERFRIRFRTALEFIQRFPGGGSLKDRERTGSEGIRSWAVPGFKRYLIFYRHVDDAIHVLAVVHGARDVFAILRNRL
jgi:toxin ParE1/3/4